MRIILIAAWRDAATPAKHGMILIRLQSLFGSSANAMFTIGGLAPRPVCAASSREGVGSGHFAARPPRRLAQTDAEALTTTAPRPIVRLASARVT